MQIRQQNDVQTTTKKCTLLANTATILPPIFIIGYVSIAAVSQQMLGWVNQFLTPFVNSLHFTGLGIIKPPMDGPMPMRFYINLTGLAIWGALVNNAVTITYLICNRRQIKFGSAIIAARKRTTSQKAVSPIRAAFMEHANVYLFFLPLTVLFTLDLLNGSHGWIVFHVKGFFVALMTTLVWVFSGAFLSLTGFLVIAYISYDLSQLFSLFSREQK